MIAYSTHFVLLFLFACLKLLLCNQSRCSFLFYSVPLCVCPLFNIHHILWERPRCRSRCRPRAHTHTSQLSGCGPLDVTPRSPRSLQLTAAAPSQQLSGHISPARRHRLQGISEARRQISDWSGQSKTMQPLATAEPTSTD